MDFTIQEDRIVHEDASGAVVAGVYFPSRGDGVVEITSTRVDASLAGQGVAGQLLTTLAETLRSDGRKAIPTCSYAVKWFSKHPEYEDLLQR